MDFITVEAVFVVEWETLVLPLHFFLRASHIESYSSHLLPYKHEADGILLFQLQAYKAASGGSNFRCGIAKVSQGVRKQFPWDNKKVAHNKRSL